MVLVPAAPKSVMPAPTSRKEKLDLRRSQQVTPMPAKPQRPWRHLLHRNAFADIGRVSMDSITIDITALPPCPKERSAASSRSWAG